MEKDQEGDERDATTVRKKAFSTGVKDSTQSSITDPTDEALKKLTSGLGKDVEETPDVSPRMQSTGWKSLVPEESNLDSVVVANATQALLDKIPSLQATVLPAISETQKVARSESETKESKERVGLKQSCDVGTDSKTTGSTNKTFLETETVERINRLAEQLSKESRKETLNSAAGSQHRYHSNPEDEKVFTPVSFGDMAMVEEPGSMARTSSVLKLSSSHQLLTLTKSMRRSTVLENYSKTKSDQAEEEKKVEVSSHSKKQQLSRDAAARMSNAESPKVSMQSIAKAQQKWKGIKSTIATKRDFVESDVQYKLLQKYNDEVIIKLPMPLKIALYEEAQPIVLKTIKGYEKMLGKSHPLTQQAHEKLIAVNHTWEMLSEL